MRLNDRQRVELALPAHMMLSVLLAGAKVNREPYGWRRKWRKGQRVRYAWHVGTEGEWRAFEDFLQCANYLEQTIMVSVADLMPNPAMKIVRRIERTHQMLIEPFLRAEIKTGEPATPKVGLMTFYLLQILVDDGWIRFGEDTDFQRALDIFLPAVEHVASVEKKDLSAQKNARQAYDRLKSEGLYR